MKKYAKISIYLNDIVELRLKGESLKTIADTYDTSTVYISKLLCKVNLTIKNLRPNKRKTEDVARIRKLKEKGLTCEEIGKIYNITRQRVSAILKSNYN